MAAWVYIFILCSLLCKVIGENSYSTSFRSLEAAKRPVTSFKLMVADPPYYRDPTRAEMEPRKLKKILGKDFNPEYTAMTEHEVHKRRRDEFLRSLKDMNSPEHEVYRKILVQSMPQHIKDLDFTMPGLRRSLGPRASRKLQLWLWKMSSCPVFSKWKYFGLRYWPPYRNIGRCGKKRSCSFPRGMKCKKAETKSVATLKWVCFQNHGVTCSWMKMDLSVITKCQCTCSHSKT